MKNRLLTRNAWHEWLINFTPKPIKMVGGVKGKVMSPFRTITPKDYSKLKHVGDVYEGGKKNKKIKNK